MEVRAIIEPHIAFLAARNATDRDIEEIWATIGELEGFFKAKTRFRANDENFHKALAAAAKNPFLSVFQAALVNVLFKFIYDIVWPEDHKGSILTYHRRIAEKVSMRDPEGAMQAMVEHLADMERILDQVPGNKSRPWLR